MSEFWSTNLFYLIYSLYWGIVLNSIRSMYLNEWFVFFNHNHQHHNKSYDVCSIHSVIPSIQHFVVRLENAHSVSIFRNSMIGFGEFFVKSERGGKAAKHPTIHVSSLIELKKFQFQESTWMQSPISRVKSKQKLRHLIFQIEPNTITTTIVLTVLNVQSSES